MKKNRVKYSKLSEGFTGRRFAIGNYATIEKLKLVDRIHLLSEEANVERRGALDLQQFETLVKKKIIEFPQACKYFDLFIFEYEV